MSINEGIGFDVKNEGASEIKQKDLNYYTDVFELGQTKEQLVIGREVEGSSGGKFYGNIIIDSTISGNITITGVGFTSKLIKFTAGYSNDASSGFSVGHYVNGRNDSLTSYENGVDYSSNSRCFRLGGTSGLGRVTSVNSDGFVLNVVNPGGITYTVMYECFG